MRARSGSSFSSCQACAFHQHHRSLLHIEHMGHTIFKGVIILLVAHGEVEANRVGIGLYPFGDDIIYGMAELFPGIVWLDLEATDDERSQAVELSRALEMPEH